MLQFRHAGGAPSVGKAASLFDLRPDEIDRDFGVIATDPSAGLYTILIDAAAIQRANARLAARKGGAEEGIFSNPHIEPTKTPE